MKVGEIPNEVYNRRGQVHKLLEMENFNMDQEDKDYQPLIPDEVQQWQKQSEIIQQPGCFSRFFGQLNKQEKPKQKEQKSQLKDHYEFYDEEYFQEQRKQIEQLTTPSDNNQKEIIHIIQPDDTLEGLQLQYGVSACKIKNFNNLHTNDIFYLKQLVIPNPTSDFQKQEIDLDKYIQEMKICRFLDEICQSEDRNRKVALFYLDICEWNYRYAAQEYLNDYKFELEYTSSKTTNKK